MTRETAPPWSQVKDALADALEQPNQGRATWLESLRCRDAALHREVLEHLAFEEEAASCLPETRAFARPRWPSPGDFVGRYRLQSVIGIGGSGIVYEAHDAELERRVAVKVLQAGPNSPLAMQRFLLEARILADLQHPRIAHVFEFGTHGEDSSGLPYLVLERVDGADDLVQYARSRDMSMKSRILLVLDVCEAVGFAHKRGIVHRDLKADNVLVDEQGRVKLIDFGIAKVCGRPSGRTHQGQLLGTLSSMSPEQCAGTAEVDARSDVYGLGVLLYELLCNAPPHDLDNRTLSGAVKAICEDPPLRPSVLAPEVNGDLEAILMRAVATSREDRYDTANDLARDLRRYLSFEPVEARSHSSLRRARLFLRRNRWPALFASAALSLLMAATAMVTLGYREAATAEAQGRKRAEQVTALLKTVLFQASPYRSNPGQPTRRDVLDEIGQRLDEEIQGDLANRGDLHATLGRAYVELGAFEEAVHHARRAVQDYDLLAGAPSLAGCAARNALSDVLDRAGRGVEAEPILLEAAAMYEELTDVPPVFRSMTASKLARARMRIGELETAEQIARGVLRDYRAWFSEDHVALGAIHGLLAEILMEQGRIDEAEQHARAAVRCQLANHGKESLQGARAQARLAGILSSKDRVESQRLLQESLATVRNGLAVGHPDRVAVEALASSL